jgi:DNA-binding NarL/FixJ family response regulator
MAQKKSKTRKTSQNKHKIVIVDDHPIIRQGLAELIDQEDDLVVCGQVEDAHQAMKAINKQKPALVVVDVSLKDSNGIELIKDIKVQHPDATVLVLSMHDESVYAERALRAGANGYIMKQEASEKIIQAIRKVLNGQVYLSDKMAANVMNKMVGAKTDAGVSAIDRLSDRELEVFTLLGQGRGTRQIAQKLHLSIKTIETYRAHIKEKLNLADAAELLQHAIQWVNDRDKG